MRLLVIFLKLIGEVLRDTLPVEIVIAPAEFECNT